MADPVAIARIAAVLSDEKTRRGIGWAVVAVLSPIIVVIALLCVLGSGAVSHNISAAQLCFQDGPLPDDTPAEYRLCIEEMRAHFADLDSAIAAINAMVEDEYAGSLDPIRVKAVFSLCTSAVRPRSSVSLPTASPPAKSAPAPSPRQMRRARRSRWSRPTM